MAGRTPRGDHSSATPVARRLSQPTRTIEPENRPRMLPSCVVPIRSCSRWGLPSPPLLPAARWALTTPLHPYIDRSRSGLISVALSLGSPPPGVTRHRVFVEPGLSSHSAFQLCCARSPGQLAAPLTPGAPITSRQHSYRRFFTFRQ